MFPALRQAIKELREGFGSELITLKDYYNPQSVAFTPANIEWYARNGYNQIAAALGGVGPAWSGENVNVSTALNHSVVWGCTRLVSCAIASVPLQVFERVTGGKQPAESHPLYPVLHDAANAYMTSFEFRQTMQANVLLYGNAYAQIVRRSGRGDVIALLPMHPASVIGFNVKAQTYSVVQADGQHKDVSADEIFHVKGLTLDGVMGLSVISQARQSVGTALSADRFAAMFYAAGGRVQYVLEMASKFKTVQEKEQFAADFREWLSCRDNWQKGLILEPGMSYKQIGLTPEDSQFLETRQFQIPEICRWFGVQPHLVGDLSRSTNNNIEHQSIEFVQHTLGPSFSSWEGAIQLRLLRSDERKQYFAEFNADGILRGDYASRTAGYASALQNGWLSINEVRSKENSNPVDGGDAHHIQLNMQTLPGTGEPTPAELAAIAQPKPQGDPNAN